MTGDVVSLFDELLDRSPAEREAYLAAHHIDAETRRTVLSLLGFARTEGGLGSIVHSAMESMFDDLEPEEGTLCGNYRLARKIGRGGMGCLYLAERHDGEVDQTAAIKLLRGGPLEGGARQRFLQERQILANLSHPNITQLLDAGHLKDGQPFLVMEFVDGVSLDDFCESCSIERRVEMIAAVCDAVAYAHQKLIVHRDLKPNNILVTREGVPKLLDFGIAKLLDTAPDVTATCERRLTPAYASPEQMRAEPTGTASDIYSLGAILYRVISGQNPAGADAPQEGPGAPLTDPDLDAIVRKAMRRNPDHRYNTATDFGDDLRAWLKGGVVEARADERWYVVRRSLRRYWVPATACAVAAVGLTLGLISAREERDLAQERFQQVRQLAAQMLDVEEEIATLPGGTKARESIIKTSTEYLEKLSGEAHGDLDLQMELAEGYRRVANVQGGFRSTNLGHTAEAQANLDRANALLKPVLEARPKDLRALKQAIEVVNLQSRILYSRRVEKELEAKLTELSSLAARYEALLASPLPPAELDFLGGVHQSLSVSFRAVSRTADSLDHGRRSIELQRRFLQSENTPTALGNLSGALSTYGKSLRLTGDLEEALKIQKESFALLERIRASRPDDFKLLVNSVAAHADLGHLLADDIGASLGRRQEAIAEYEKCLDLGRRGLQKDAKETMIRFNTAICAWRQGNLLQNVDAERSIAVHREAISLIRGLPRGAGGREVALASLLGESTFALRAVGNEAEARRNLDEARKLANATKDAPADTIGSAWEAISRAEADWALAAKHPAEAAKIHEKWLAGVRYGEPAVKTDRRAAFMIARRYGLLADALRASRDQARAEEIERKRAAVLQPWGVHL